MDLTDSALSMMGRTPGAGLQPYVLEDQRFFFLTHIFSLEANRDNFT
jgi:hypothetical protein